MPISYKKLILFFLFVLGSAAHTEICNDALSRNYYTAHDNGRISFGIGGGARVYPEAYTLKNMGLTNDQISSMEGKILLVGEGYGNLMPLFAQAKNADVTAVDPIYALDPIPPGFMGDLLGKFIEKYKEHLQPSSSADLPYPSDSIDAIYSHLLLNNFIELKKDADGQEIEDQYQTTQMAVDSVREAIRVLKSGKSAVFAVLLSRREIINLMKKVEQSYGDSPIDFTYDVKTHRIWTNYRSFGALAPDLSKIEAGYYRVGRFKVTKK